MVEKQNKNVSANARRQAAFSSRMRKSGKKRVAFWVTPEEEIRLRNLLKGRTDPETETSGLPKLVGSEKQIDWANDIRSKRLRSLTVLLDPKNSWPSAWSDYFSGILPSQGRLISEENARTQRSEIINLVRSIPNAHWWIETRQLNTRDFLLEACDWIRVREYALPSLDRIGKPENDKFMEGMIIPPNPHGAIVEIQQNHNRIGIRLSVYDEKAIGILKKYCFHWEDKRGIWERTVDIKRDPQRDTQYDRAVEVGVRFLQSGHAVFIVEKSLREKVVIGDFQPEVFRRVETSKSEKYGMRFYFLYNGEKDAATLAHLLTKIRGSKAYPDAAYVPSSRFEEVEDFAEAHGFTLTEKARDLVSQERRTKSLRLVGVDPGQKSSPKEKRTLKTATGEIDAELLDNPG